MRYLVILLALLMALFAFYCKQEQAQEEPLPQQVQEQEEEYYNEFSKKIILLNNATVICDNKEYVGEVNLSWCHVFFDVKPSQGGLMCSGANLRGLSKEDVIQTDRGVRVSYHWEVINLSKEQKEKLITEICKAIDYVQRHSPYENPDAVFTL